MIPTRYTTAERYTCTYTQNSLKEDIETRTSAGTISILISKESDNLTVQDKKLNTTGDTCYAISDSEVTPNDILVIDSRKYRVTSVASDRHYYITMTRVNLTL